MNRSTGLNRSAGLGPGLVAASAVALVLTLALPQSAQAETLPPALSAWAAGVANASGTAVMTDVSAVRRRRPVRRVYRNNNNAAGLAFMGLALGAVGTVIANERRRDYYRQDYYYGGNPYYGRSYYGGPAYYGNPYYGGSPYYGY